MSVIGKLFKKFLSKLKNFTYKELKVLLGSFDYKETRTGKTSGSRVAFTNSQTKHIIRLHRPHKEKELKEYQMNDIIKELKRVGIIE